MRAVKKCQGCGKSISGGFLCEECEAAALETHKGRRYTLSAITGIVLLTATYIAWTKYKERRSEIDLSVFSRLYNSLMAFVKAVLSSPYLMIPLVIILIIAAFIIGARLSK